MSAYQFNSRTILIVEDSDDDFETTKMALREANLMNPIVRCEDGQDALDYLYGRGSYLEKHIRKPGIILLDLNMPGIDGREVLSRIKSDKQLKSIPVVVFTTSPNERDIDACYMLGANSYVQKPVDLDNFVLAIKRLKEYWLEISIFPRIDK